MPVEIGPEALDLLIATRWLLQRDSADARLIGEAIASMLIKAAAE